jgi:hypothetical protein
MTAQATGALAGAQRSGRLVSLRSPRPAIRKITGVQQLLKD